MIYAFNRIAITRDGSGLHSLEPPATFAETIAKSYVPFYVLYHGMKRGLIDATRHFFLLEPVSNDCALVRSRSFPFAIGNCDSSAGNLLPGPPARIYMTLLNKSSRQNGRNLVAGHVISFNVCIHSIFSRCLLFFFVFLSYLSSVARSIRKLFVLISLLFTRPSKSN